MGLLVKIQDMAVLRVEQKATGLSFRGSFRIAVFWPITDLKKKPDLPIPILADTDFVL